MVSKRTNPARPPRDWDDLLRRLPHYDPFRAPGDS